MTFKTYKVKLVMYRMVTSVAIILFGIFAIGQSSVYAQDVCGGKPYKPVPVSISFGCIGKGNPIMDMTFAIIGWLSGGVGLVIIASLIVAGIQFTSSRGDPQATAKALKRIQSNVTALILFFFAYAIVNYVVPGAVLK